MLFLNLFTKNIFFSIEGDLNIDLTQSILIGDRLSDILCAYNAGIKNIIHVLTGHGKEERKSVIDSFLDSEKYLTMINDLTEFPYKEYFNS